MFTFYLAGSINGKTFDDANNWRSQIEGLCVRYGHDFRNPLRGKDVPKLIGVMQDAETSIDPRYILDRDLKDIEDSDYVIANMSSLGGLPMIGTLMELGIALSLGKEIFIFDCPQEYRSHPFFSDFVFLDCMGQVEDLLKMYSY